MLGCHGCSEQFIEVFKNKRDIISYFFYLVCSEKAICGYSQEAFNPFRYFQYGYHMKTIIHFCKKFPTKYIYWLKSVSFWRYHTIFHPLYLSFFLSKSAFFKTYFSKWNAFNSHQIDIKRSNAFYDLKRVSSIIWDL